MEVDSEPGLGRSRQLSSPQAMKGKTGMLAPEDTPHHQCLLPELDPVLTWPFWSGFKRMFPMLFLQVSFCKGLGAQKG